MESSRRRLSFSVEESIAFLGGNGRFLSRKTMLSFEELDARWQASFVSLGGRWGCVVVFFVSL
jgi:hypothetical protein